MKDRWIVKFTLPRGTTGRVGRIFTEEAAKKYAATMNELRADCRYEATPAPVDTVVSTR